MPRGSSKIKNAVGVIKSGMPEAVASSVTFSNRIVGEQTAQVHEIVDIEKDVAKPTGVDVSHKYDSKRNAISSSNVTRIHLNLYYIPSNEGVTAEEQLLLKLKVMLYTGT